LRLEGRRAPGTIDQEATVEQVMAFVAVCEMVQAHSITSSATIITSGEWCRRR